MAVSRSTRTVRGRLQPGQVGVEAEEVATDGLVMLAATLDLLRHCMGVAEAALEGLTGKDGGSSGRVVDDVRHLRGALDGVGGGQPQVNALLEVELVGAIRCLPGLRDRLSQVGARRA